MSSFYLVCFFPLCSCLSPYLGFYWGETEKNMLYFLASDVCAHEQRNTERRRRRKKRKRKELASETRHGEREKPRSSKKESDVYAADSHLGMFVDDWSKRGRKLYVENLGEKEEVCQSDLISSSFLFLRLYRSSSGQVFSSFVNRLMTWKGDFLSCRLSMIRKTNTRQKTTKLTGVTRIIFLVFSRR